jgi:hypothetical protein
MRKRRQLTMVTWVPHMTSLIYTRAMNYDDFCATYKKVDSEGLNNMSRVRQLLRGDPR